MFNLKVGSVYNDRVQKNDGDARFITDILNFYSVNQKVDNLTSQAQGILGLQY